MDEATKAFFRKQQEEPENQVCIDLGTANPQWASISHGCYICLESSGVHRSLGVHISFVRSTTMDSWKPLQLKLMELGGNQKLRAFFRQHSIPDDMPIAQKYNTRAAEWYRRNLRALAEGNEPPPPLQEGTGNLPVAEAASLQLPFAKAGIGSITSAGGAFASDARHYGGGYHAGDVASSGPRRVMTGFGSDGPSPSSRASSSESLGSERSSPQDGQQDFFGNLLGPEVGARVSTSMLTAVSFAGSLAHKAKSYAETKVAQAQDEGWLDTAVDTTKHGVGAAVETTSWAAQRASEAGKATYTYVNEGGGKAVLGKTQEVIGSTARGSAALLGTANEWLTETIGSLTEDRTATGLQSMSSGTMQGFGSDYRPDEAPLSPAPAEDLDRILAHIRPGEARQVFGGAAPKPLASYHADLTSSAREAPRFAGPGTLLSTGGAPATSGVPLQSQASAQQGRSSQSKAASRLWDDDWGDWK